MTAPELEEMLDEGLVRAVLSSPTRAATASKVTVRPVELGGELSFQFEYREGASTRHMNLSRAEAVATFGHLVQDEFKQALVQTDAHDYHVLGGDRVLVRPPSARPAELAHDRRKRRLVPEGVPVPFLVELGVMTPDGRVRAPQQKKFRQINRFLELVTDALPANARRIVDFGSGKSYLTFALYHLLVVDRGLDVEIVGLDLKEDVIERCTDLAATLGYERLRFEVGDIATYEGAPADVVVSLHACDTATDAALERAVRWNAEVILAVPCCQHELMGQIEDDVLQPILRHGLLRERFAALATDAARAQLLDAVGYRTQVVEFVDLEHTAKNVLIRCTRNAAGPRPSAFRDYRAFKEQLHIEPTLERLLSDRLPVA